MPQNVPLFRKENEREQRSHDYGKTREDGVDAGTDIKKRDRLGDLMTTFGSEGIRPRTKARRSSRGPPRLMWKATNGAMARQATL